MPGRLIRLRLREIIRRDHDDGFPADRIRTEYAGTYRSMSFNEDGIKNLLNTKNINGETLIVMSYGIAVRFS